MEKREKDLDLLTDFHGIDCYGWSLSAHRVYSAAIR
jgi:hypothetical protein